MLLQALTGLHSQASVSKRELQRAFYYLAAGEGLPAGYISAQALESALVLP